MYDKSVYLEDMCTEGATGYVAQRTNFLVQRMAGSTSGYYFGGNLYAEDDEAIADRASFANESGNTIYAAVPTMIRNASDLKVTIRNAETGEVYRPTTTARRPAHITPPPPPRGPRPARRST